MDYLLTDEIINEVHNLEQAVYQCDENGTTQSDTIEELNASNGLNDYISWMETQILKRKNNRLEIIRGICHGIN